MPEVVPFFLEVLEGVLVCQSCWRACNVYRRPWKILHGVGTAGDALCAEVLEVVFYALEMLEVMR